MGIALKAEDISIRYITGDFKDIGIKEYATRKLTHNYHVKEFMAVDGVSFELQSGDMLGIIGSNGAGKSTLLKAISGIMEPTRGKITANGEIAALLELGSGFDGDLTVKENAYLRGAMLGYTKAFMDETYDQIIEFAELREFEDRPFKQLSSGMKSRLAFSIASLVDPDILILDEVLSVGDGAFQEKSAQKMREIIAGGATTILVSHSLDQIRALCNKVLWLDHGKQIAFGETQEICDRYEQFLQGECPATMEDGVQTESVPAACAPAQQPPASLPKSRRRNWGRAGLSAGTLGLFAALIAFTAASEIAVNNASSEDIQIYAEVLGGVTYRGTGIGDSWYSPRDTVTSSDGWTHNEDQDTYTATNVTTPLTVRLPVQSGRTMIFTAGPEQGRTRVELSGGTVTYYDLSNPETVELGLPYDLPDTQDTETASRAGEIAALAGLLTALVVLALALLGRPAPQQKETSDREVWGDLVRVGCCFVIVLLHNTCNTFDDYADGRISTLIVNSFTAFSVPCFFMISGAYLLRKKQSVRRVLTTRVPKLYIPLLFWSILYILASGNLDPRQFLKMFYQQQTTHLWFIYSMVGVYLLLPLLGWMFCGLSTSLKAYLAILLLFIPGLWHDFGALGGFSLPSFHFAIFWPDLGLFFCGAILWDNRERIQKLSPILYAAAFLTGLAMTSLLTVYTSWRAGQPDKAPFISCIGSVGNLVMASSAFCLALSLEKHLAQLPGRVISVIHTLGEASMGIYFIHMFFLLYLNSDRITALPLHTNSGSMLSMVVSAIAYFALSALVCWCGRQTPLLKRVF